MTPLLFLSAVALAAPPELSVAYHGDFITHPGASARTAFGALEVQTGTWWHPKNQTVAYLRTGPAFRFTGPRNGTWGGFAHVGVLGALWAAPTYRVDAGDVRRGPGGDAWINGVAGLELGRHTPDAPIDGWFVRPQMGARFPTFHGMGLDLAVEIGVRFGGAS